MADRPPLVMQDPPEHTAFRKLVSRGFTPRAVREVEPEVRAFVVERLDAAGGGRGRRRRDRAVQAAAEHGGGALPRRPAEDRGRFDGWTDAIVAASSGGDPLRAADAAAELLGYFTALVERRRARPRRRHRLPPRGRGRWPPTRPTSTAWSACSATCSRWSPAATTPPPACSAAASSCSPGTPTSAPGSPPTRPRPGRRRGAAPAHLPGAGAGAHHHPRGRAARHDDPGRSQGAAAATAPPTATRGEYGPDADELDVDRRPKQILTFSRAHHCLGAFGRADADPGGAGGAARPDARARGRRGRHHLGRRPVRAPSAHGAGQVPVVVSGP